MKLSDVKGDRVLDVIADCIEPIANITADEEASRLFRREVLPEGKELREFTMERVVSSVPVLLKKHKGDVITILASIEGVSKKAYKESLTVGKLINDCTELISDKEFLKFFTSAQSGKAGGSSGSARENTTADQP